MEIDRNFCANSYLMYRYVYDDSYSFCKDYNIKNVNINYYREPISNSKELKEFIKDKIQDITYKNKAALALSGGIDSIILASFMPKGSTCYTFKCIVPGKKVIDESKRAGYYAKKFDLKHKVIEITFEDVKNSLKNLMQHKGAPIHSIECQIYKAAKVAKNDGFNTLIFGESADIIYGGMNKLLAYDWDYEKFIERYCYILPYKILRDPELLVKPFIEFENKGKIDAYKFINKYFLQESLGSYINSCSCAGIEFYSPYSLTYLKNKIDYDRIRSGDTKYIVREVYRDIFPNEEIPEKIPMPRPVDEWFQNWGGPTHKSFINNINNLTGDQKWMVWCLEEFLNMLDSDNDA